MKTPIYLLLATTTALLLECGKESGNKGILKKEDEVKNQLSKSEYKIIAEETKKNLIGNLTQKISEKGVENALEFCNVNAIPLTKKLEGQYRVTIKRVSDKNRNPKNVANETELKIMERFRMQLAQKEELKATMEGGIFYAPITTNAMCLQCHGSENMIKPETLAKIKSLYPNDKAIGYKENELRGLLAIEEN